MSEIRRRALKLARKRIERNKAEAKPKKKDEKEKEGVPKKEKKEISFTEKKKLKEQEERIKERKKLAQSQIQLEQKIREEKEKKRQSIESAKRKKEQERFRIIEEQKQKRIEEERKKKELEWAKRKEQELKLLDEKAGLKNTEQKPKTIKTIDTQKNEEKRTEYTHTVPKSAVPEITQKILFGDFKRQTDLLENLTLEKLVESDMENGLIDVESFLNEDFIEQNIDRIRIYSSNTGREERLDREELLLSQKEGRWEEKENYGSKEDISSDLSDIPGQNSAGNGINIINIGFVKSLKSMKHLFLPYNFKRLLIYRNYQLSLFRDNYQDNTTSWLPVAHSSFRTLLDAYNVLKYKGKGVKIRSTKHILDLEEADLNSAMFDILFFGLAEYDPESDSININELGLKISATDKPESLLNYVINFLLTDEFLNSMLFRIKISNGEYPADIGDLGKIIDSKLAHGQSNSMELKRVEKSFFSYLKEMKLAKFTKKRAYRGGKTRFVNLTKFGKDLTDKIVRKKFMTGNETRLFYHKKIDSKIKCPECHRFVLSTFALCPYCSHSLQKICIRCKNVIQKGYKICPYCSAVLIKNNL
ncbi:MAG: hypothetical protein ACTSWY_02100 [Promethearchaeota archaeon]